MSAQTAQASEFNLTILHTADLRSRFAPINSLDASCDAEADAKGLCEGGVARLRTRLVERRIALAGEGRPVLTLDPGGQLGGSLFHTVFRGRAAAEFVNALGYDAVGLGASDLAAGTDSVLLYLTSLRVPAISGNVLASLGSPLAGRLPPYMIREIGGDRVAILSVAGSAWPGPPDGAGVLIGDEIAALRPQVAEAIAAGIDKVIVLSHAGLARDIEIAEAVDGIDLIVGGGSHTAPAGAGDGKAGYPRMTEGPSGAPVAIVHAGAHGRWLGEIALTFDANGRISRTAGAPVRLDAGVTPDPAMAARVSVLAEAFPAAMARPVGETAEAVAFNAEACQAGPCQAGTLVAEAMLDYAAADGASVAIVNAGLMRDGFDAGPVSLGEVLAALPFQQAISVLELPGADLEATLAHGLSVQDGQYPHVAGIRVAYRSGSEGGAMIRGILVRESGEWRPLDRARSYRVAVPAYLRLGGDGYAALTVEPDRRVFGPNLEDIVIGYLGTNSPYMPVDDGRIERAETVRPPGERRAPAAAPVMDKGADTATVGVSSYPTPAGAPQRYRIRRGDTLSTLSQKFYGTSRRWREIERANPNLRRRGLRIGDEIVIPAP